MRSLSFAVALLAMGVSARSSQQQPAGRDQQAPTFRGGVIAVPIEVRVVDKDGRSITDLRKEDFTVLEDGLPQEIVHFNTQVLAADTPGAAPRARPDVVRFDSTRQNHRVFLIVIGTRGLGETDRHPETLNALIKFVRGLLPQDQVAVLAPPTAPRSYNRAIDFTSDRDKVEAFLETFRAAQAGRQAEARSRARSDTSPAEQSPAAADVRAVFAAPGAASEKAPTVTSELGFEEYVKAWGKQSLGSELDFMHYAIKYLRFINGEKHLVFVTERGPTPTWEQYRYLTTLAADARVALDTIQIGEWVNRLDLPRRFGDGLEPSLQPASPASGVSNTGRGTDPTTGRPTADTQTGPGGGTGQWPVRMYAFPYDLRAAAAQTGGQASYLGAAGPALARIDEATRAYYTLGYYPSKNDWNGKYRSVKVVVKRPGATVLFRHGYYARREADTFDRRQIVSSSRMDGAGYDMRDLNEIDVRFAPAFRRAETGRGGELVLDLSVDVSRVAWTLDDEGMHVAHLEAAIYCGDGGDNIVGQARRTLNLSLTDESYQRVMKERFTHQTRVAVTEKPREVKVIVYDYDTDRIGSSFLKLAGRALPEALPGPVPPVPAPAATPSSAAPAPARRDPALDPVLARVADYVARYAKEASAVVAEEIYEQHVWTSTITMTGYRDVPQSRKIVSDYLLVKVPGADSFLPFRDVFQVDGKPVRERDNRLERLFVQAPADKAIENANAIWKESARYNIGPIRRNLNVPTLALLFVSGQNAARFQFTRRGEQDEGGVRTWVVEYREIVNPTIIRTAGGASVPARGRLWVEPASGTIVKTSLEAGDASIAVSYKPWAETPGLWLPESMEEWYGSSTHATARYSKMRRFRVFTEEKIQIKH